MRLTKFSIAVLALSASSLLLAIRSPADTPRPLGIFNGVTPTTGPAIVDGLLTDQQKRDKINALWDQQDGIGPNTPHARWEVRSGIIAATKVATTGPSTMPSDAGLSATLVSVHLNNLSARAALSAFGKQTGIHLSLFPARSWRSSLYGKVTLNADRVPLLEAVNELCCQAGLAHDDGTIWWGQPKPVFDPAHPRMVLEMQQPGNALAPWDVCGPFAFSVQSISHALQLTSKGSIPEPVTIQFRFQSEPGVVVVGQSQFPTVVEAVDDKGHHLNPGQNSQPQPQRRLGFWGRLLAPRSVPVQAEDLWQSANQPLLMSLDWPDDAGHTLVHLRATTRLLIQVKSEKLDADFSASPKAQNIGIAGLNCTVGPYSTQSPQQGSTQLSIRRGKQTPAEWRQLCAAIGGITPRFLDSGGNAAQQVQTTGCNSTDNQVTASYYWFNQYNPEDGTVAKTNRFTMDIPVEIKVVQAPIEFDNLPLP